MCTHDSTTIKGPFISRYDCTFAFEAEVPANCFESEWWSELGPDFTPIRNGTYQVTYNKYKNGNLYSTTKTFDVNLRRDCPNYNPRNPRVRSRSQSTQLSDYVTIAPNPTSGLLQLKLHERSDLCEVKILNLNGSSVYQQNYQDQDIIDLDLTNFARGLYFIEIKENEQVYISKIIVN